MCITVVLMSLFDSVFVYAAGDLPVKDIFDEEGVELTRLCLRIPREVSPPTRSIYVSRLSCYSPPLVVHGVGLTTTIISCSTRNEPLLSYTNE